MAKTPGSPLPETKRRRKRRKNPFVPTRTKAKSPQQRWEAHMRAAALSKANAIEDQDERRKAQQVFERTYLSKAIQQKEPKLQPMVWVEYGYIGSLDRTILFAQEFIAAYRRAYAHIDPKVARRKQPIKANLAQNSSDVICSLYKARQEADRRGMPYGLFLDILMQGKVVNDKHKQPPMPNQMLSDGHSIARLKHRPTRDEISSRLFLRHWDRRFFAARTEDDPVQAAAMRELYADVLRADDSGGRLARYLSIHGLIDEARARAMFEGDLADAAIKRATKTRGPKEVYAPADYKPACFGHRIIAKDTPCLDCPFTRPCKAFRASVTGTLISTTGSGDPFEARRRVQARDRKRKQRAKARKEPEP
ncbi:hypothetical protein LK996_11100 [Lysobacter sp. A6]|uniref:Uncharacterized protein n=1 Tax=Noviluteimonas lactosilytica TaxID=2888523 RepID=A0ABS8JJA9_9GAMM|nr:hypothetical protein [Lysobacter lactosilyticus]MCC8363615.1 hypothetical protein [Lysobacter lactosilyticus]